MVRGRALGLEQICGRLPIDFATREEAPDHSDPLVDPAPSSHHLRTFFIATIFGDLRYVPYTKTMPLSFNRCDFDEFDVRDATLQALRISDSQFSGSFALRNVSSHGPLTFSKLSILHGTFTFETVAGHDVLIEKVDSGVTISRGILDRAQIWEGSGTIRV